MSQGLCDLGQQKIVFSQEPTETVAVDLLFLQC